MKTRTNTRYYLLTVLWGLLAGLSVFISALVQEYIPLRLPGWVQWALFSAGMLAIVAYGLYLNRRRPFLSRTWVTFATLVAVCFNGLGLVSAAYTGPLNRTITNTVYRRDTCSYRATLLAPYSGSCSIQPGKIFASPGGCPGSTSGGYFSNSSTSCGGSWPGTCGSGGVDCTITLTGSSTVGCSSGEDGCTAQSSSTTYAPASVSGTPGCDAYNGSWCVSGARLSLSGGDTYPGASITGFEGPGGGLCSGSSCQWNVPDGIYSNMPYWSTSSHNDTSYQAFFSMNVDTVPPALSINTSALGGSPGWYLSPATLTTITSDATSGVATVSYQMDGGGWTSGASVTVSGDGQHTVDFQVTDNAGHVTGGSRTFSIDSVPPALTVDVSEPDGSAGWHLSPATLTAITSDVTSGVATVGYQVDGGGWTSGASVTISASGVHTVDYQVTDNAGNTTSSSQTVLIDTAPPQSAFTDPAEGSTIVVVGVVTMSGQTTDPISGPASGFISLDGGNNWLPLPINSGAWSYTWDTKGASNGSHTVLVSADDQAGNQEHTAEITVIVSNAPPFAGISPEWSVFGNADVTIRAGSSPLAGASITVSDPDARWPDVVYEFGPGNMPSSFAWVGRAGDGSIALAGKYKVTVRAWDAYGLSAAAIGWVVIPLAPTPVPTRVSRPAPTQEPQIILPLVTQAPFVPIPEPAQAPVVVPPAPPMIDPVYLWPALALGAFLAVLSANAFSNKKHRAYRDLLAAMEAIRLQNARSSFENEEN